MRMLGLLLKLLFREQVVFCGVRIFPDCVHMTPCVIPPADTSNQSGSPARRDADRLLRSSTPLGASAHCVETLSTIPTVRALWQQTRSQ
jgi:hypothetical protein